MDGWIKYYRKSIQDPLYFSEPFTKWQAWTDLLLLANHKESTFTKRGIGIVIYTGQIGYDLETLAKRWKWSRGKAERYMKSLETDMKIVRQKSNVTTIISICNYIEYQSGDKANSKANSKAKYQKTDTNNNIKNKNEKNKEYIIIDFAQNFDFSFCTSGYEDLLKTWLSYKKSKNQTYKSEDSIKIFYKKLIEYSGSDLDKAKIIIENSMCNNWAGIFPMKETTNISKQENSRSYNRKSQLFKEAQEISNINKLATEREIKSAI